MINQILTELAGQIVPIVATALVGIIVAIIKVLGDVAIDALKSFKQYIVAKIDVEKYNEELQVAKNVFFIVDEYFKISPNIEKTIELAQAKFEEEILKKLPYLTKDEIEHLRQAIAGEVNKGKDVIVTPVEVASTVTPVVSIPSETKISEVAQTVVTTEPITKAPSNLVSEEQHSTIVSFHNDSVDETVTASQKAEM